MPSKRKPKSELITQAEYARQRGLNKSTISRQVRDAIIPTHGERRLIDPAEADEARRTKTDPTRGRHKPKAPPAEKKQAPQRDVRPVPSTPSPRAKTSDSASFADARAYGQELKNQQAEIELARLRGELIDRDAVRKAMAELAQAAVSAWIQWPARVYAEMAAELGVDGATLHQSLDRHVRQYAEEISRAPVEFKEPDRKKSA